MTRNALALAALIAATLPRGAAAQPRSDAPDWARGRHEYRKDARAARDDWRDLKRVEALLADYDRAAGDRNRGALGQLEEEAQAILRREWAEGQEELARARADAARKREELRDDRRDPRADPQERRDDRRDLHGARRDAEVEERALERVRQIGDELFSLRGRYRRGEVARKRELIESMVRMARAELRGDRKELRDEHR
jgi:hypothetical protein